MRPDARSSISSRSSRAGLAPPEMRAGSGCRYRAFHFIVRNFTISPGENHSVHLVRNLVGVKIDFGDDLVNVVIGDAFFFEGCDEVLGEALEFAAADGEMTVDLGEGATAVGNRPARGHGEEK